MIPTRNKTFSFIKGIPILVFCIVLFGMSWSFSSICVAFEPLEINVRLGRFFQGDPCYTGPCTSHLDQ
jgi:hypothetical protein